MSIDPRSREVTVDGKPVDLTRKEFDLLVALARRPGAVVTKRELLAEVWGLPWGGGDNGLADRIDEVIAVEREAVADLSHRLRTPLTALRLQVEALPDRDRAEELNVQVNSLERTFTAVISAARRPQREGRVPHCDAVAVTRQRAAFWEPLFEDQGRELTLDLPTPPADVRSSAEDLAAALDALVENVVAHTPDGTPARIILTGQQVAGNAGVLIVVADEGPGIPLGSGERGPQRPWLNQPGPRHRPPLCRSSRRPAAG
ncbi:winged helix-turn-helix domain-containing protein [Kribbella qitaiheensis]|uniref:winged helix-turn-helix domain-containing protein n=1 Tax=Kribbella qitaiheensis TaxID=1544730 RepID=UPI0019D513D6|nr:winged helix-turn-helix domain-containing protein [Kribbella qitaiheensis]